ncbi:HAMP domain-containing histidine kinase [bacterium]|nr:HAMP domain-containing histidine kinase [bacterium]
MGPLNNEQRELLMLTKDSCNFMYEMLSTLLSTYKYENGDYTLNYEKCNFISLVEETVNELDSMQKEKNVTIHINKKGNIFVTECDRMQIKRVLTNILGNAISYAYNNTPIFINIKQNEQGINFEAKNKSAYINPETMNNLFKKYVSHAAKFNKVGVGLGLYLSKQIIVAHKGDIYAKSFEDNHNIFGFYLPMVNMIKNEAVISN